MKTTQVLTFFSAVAVATASNLMGLGSSGGDVTDIVVNTKKNLNNGNGSHHHYQRRRALDNCENVPNYVFQNEEPKNNGKVKDCATWAGKKKNCKKKDKVVGNGKKKVSFYCPLECKAECIPRDVCENAPSFKKTCKKINDTNSEKKCQKIDKKSKEPISFFCPQQCDIENCPPATCPSMDTEGNPVQTECSPGSKCIEQEDGRILQGELLKAVNNGQDPINEPCYDGQVSPADKVCNYDAETREGYFVCCVTKGTCPGIISSNRRYYVGGCGKSAAAWENPDCQEQGECHIKYIKEELGGFVNDPNLATDFAELPKNVRKELKKRESICVAN
mmetsp:Transcript_48172/g.54588  ORF Transcript_48172/g.54588 Transcript_48172/m.54588 type:complete len:333 (-) Transcript_48172:394-1392(-)